MTNTNQQPSEAEVKSVIALFSNGEYQQAIDEIAILSKNFPKSHMLHNIKGACYAGLGQLDSAVKSYEKAIIIKPDYAKAHFNLGGALHDLTLKGFGHLDGPVQCYKKSIEIDPDLFSASSNVANIYVSQLTDFEAAITKSNETLKIYHKNYKFINFCYFQ